MLDSTYRIEGFQIDTGDLVSIGTLLGLSYSDYTQGGAYNDFWGLYQMEAYEFVMGDGNTIAFNLLNEKVGSSSDTGNLIQMDDLTVRVIYRPPAGSQPTLIFPPVL